MFCWPRFRARLRPGFGMRGGLVLINARALEPINIGQSIKQNPVSHLVVSPKVWLLLPAAA
jgi:hypothetical protein